MLAAALGDVDHHVLFVGLAEARLFPLEAKARRHLFFSRVRMEKMVYKCASPHGGIYK